MVLLRLINSLNKPCREILRYIEGHFIQYSKQAHSLHDYILAKKSRKEKGFKSRRLQRKI